MKKWFQEQTSQVLKDFKVKADCGLSNNESKKILLKNGFNKLESSRKTSPIALFFGQFKDVLIIILIVAAIVSWAVGLTNSGTDSGAQEAILIFAIVLAIAVIGFLNEYKAEKTVEELKKLVGYRATVRRNGNILEIDATEVVLGDIVILGEGQKIPADLRLVTVHNLEVSESSLTGESLPVEKSIQAIEGDASVGDQRNMAFAGTFVTQGTAEGVVVATAKNTELGKIASLVESVETEQTPMQKKLDQLGKKLGIFVLAVSVVVFVAILIFAKNTVNGDFLQRVIFAFTVSVALAVAAIPEGLAFVVRISLALGARRMAKKNGLVRRLSAVEALGSTDIICTDKTGTLTRGEMTVRKVVTDKVVDVEGSGYSLTGGFTLHGNTIKLDSVQQRLLLLGVICNNARLDQDIVLGDPTEGALLVSAGKAGIDYQKVKSKMKRLDELPFSSKRKFMSVVVANNGEYMVASKGALEATLDNCKFILDSNGERVNLTDSRRLSIIKQNKVLSSQSLRVLAFAFKEVKNRPKANEIERDLTYAGLQAMMDPPRSEVKDVIRRIQDEAGMRVVMITGDYIETAKAIALEVGIKGLAISGVELEKLTQEEFIQKVEEISVYARVNPEHKIRIVQALKSHGHQVAMTGDGVNDTPAIKAADIGVAMGITGTDATKEAADLILLDDQFVTIVNAIEEGRGIYDNVRKFVNFLISSNIAEVLVVLMGILVFNNLVLTAVQLLFINIVTDGIPAVALGSDPAQANELQASPKRFQEDILTKRIWAEIYIFGILMTFFVLVQYWFNITHGGSITAMSAVFTALVIYEIIRLIDIRTDYNIKWFSNPLLSISILLSVLMQLSVLYIPYLANYFGVVPISATDWLFMGVGSVILLVVMKSLNPVLDNLLGNERHAETVITSKKPS